MNKRHRIELDLIQQLVRALRNVSKDDEAFKRGLNLSVMGLEWAIDVFDDNLIGYMRPREAIDSIGSSMAELHIRLENYDQDQIDDASKGTRYAIADRLLRQACILLAEG